MDITPEKYGSWERASLDAEKLRSFFVKHLNHVYLAKQHLLSSLPILAKKALFSDLKDAIEETVFSVEKQVARIEMIYTILDEVVGNQDIHGLSGIIDDAMEAIHDQANERELRDLSILFYLQNIEGLEMSSFQILQMAAIKLKNKQVIQLLEENYRDAKASRTLFLLISSKYIIK